MHLEYFVISVKPAALTINSIFWRSISMWFSAFLWEKIYFLMRHSFW